MKYYIFLMLVLAMPLTACQSYRTPSMSGDPAQMSSDTLCFRYASSKDPELGAEIARRNLDCARLLESDPLLNHRSHEIDRAHRIGR